MIFTVLLCVLAFLLYFVCIAKAPKRGDPPHPGWLPLVGSLPYLREPLEEFLAEKFPTEPIVTVYFGLEKLYCINSQEALTEAFVTQGDKFLARPRAFLLKYLTGEWGGIILSDGEQWRQYRRFTLRTLRDFGFGRQGVEEIILAESEELCAQIAASARTEEPVDTVPLMSTAVSNVICQLVFGSRLASEDPKFERILQIFQRITQSQGNRTFGMLLQLHQKYYTNFWPLFRLVMRLRKSQLNVFTELIDFCRGQLVKHKAEVGNPDQPRDYIEAFLHLQVENPEQFNEVRLSLAVVDLFLAGTDTTSHTLRWAILFLIENPEVEKRLYGEIKNVVGSERPIVMKDKSQLHYTQAVLDEVHRLASLAQLGVSHRSTEASRVCGFEIPADSIVIFNIYGMHQSAQHFPQPQLFKPERFLDSEGRYTPSEYLVPFGVGKRACLGESLARMELFLFFTRLVQRFTFRMDPSEKRPLSEIKANVGHQGGGIRAPAAHRIVFGLREE